MEGAQGTDSPGGASDPFFPPGASARVCLGGLGSNMLIEIGHVEAIFRYPVKSMSGERLEAARMGWHGLEDDRRLAFRRIDDRSGFPWLTASKLPDLLL